MVKSVNKKHKNVLITYTFVSHSYYEDVYSVAKSWEKQRAKD